MVPIFVSGLSKRSENVGSRTLADARRHHTHEIERHLKTLAHTSFLLLAPNYEFVSHELPRGQCSHTPRSDLVHLVLALAAQALEASSNHAG